MYVYIISVGQDYIKANETIPNNNHFRFTHLCSKKYRNLKYIII